MSQLRSPAKIAASLTELWSLRVIAELDDSYVNVAKVHGSEECHRMLVERKSTLHTDSEITDRTRSIEEQPRAL